MKLFATILAAGLFLVAGVGPARAQLFTVGDFQFTLTETLYADWHKDFEFRHTTKDDVKRTGRYDYFAIKNRLNIGVQSSWLSGGIRLDTAVFVGPLEDGIPHDDFISRFDDDYVNPEKVFLRIRQKRFSIEAGDVYGCLGKGIALCIKKVDQLASDVTLRGGKATYNSQYVGLTILGGLSNIVNVGDIIEGKLPDPNDLIVGGELRVSPVTWLKLSGHASLVKDSEDYEDMLAEGRNSRRQQVWVTGGTVSIPDLHGFGFMAEYDFMSKDTAKYSIEQGNSGPKVGYETENSNGHAVYALLTYDKSIFHFMGEFKFYAGFDESGAISREVNNGLTVGSKSAKISETIYYGVLPPLEDENMFYRQADFFDVIGGRARLDFEIPASASILWASYSDFEWLHAPEVIDTHTKDFYVRHVIGGIEQRIDKWSFVGNLSGGYRRVQHGIADSVRNVWHIDADLHFPIYGPHSMELAGRFEAHDYEVVTEQDFNTTQASITYAFAPHIALSYTYEYSDQPGTGLKDNHFHGGEIAWRFMQGSHVKLFGGSTRGGLRCAGGQCRVFPDFKGIKGEITLRF